MYDCCMPAEKRKKERMNIWVALVVRPLSVLLTIPLINTRIRPSDITILSIIFSVVGFILFVLGNDDMLLKIVGWLCFFVWAILDGVDGNLARCQHTTSTLGELWDSVGGYAAMVLLYLSAGIAAYHDSCLTNFCNNYLLILLGGICAVSSIFPRLIMHRKHNIMPEKKDEDGLNHKESYSSKQIIVMNFISVSGFMQVVFLASILTHTLNFFILLYSCINITVMLLSLRILMKE